MGKRAFEKIAAGLTDALEMTKMNAMQKAFEVAGLRPEDVAFDLAIAKYLNSGGTIARARARLDVAAARMPGMDQGGFAPESHSANVQTRQPYEEGRAIPGMSQDLQIAALPSSPVEDVRGHVSTVQQDQNYSASPSSSLRGGRDQAAIAQKGQLHDVPPVREPKPQRSPIDFGAASLAVKTKLAESVFDRYRTSDGTPWGNVGAHELDSLSRDGALASALKSHLGVLSNRQRFMTIRELVKPETFEELRRRAHGA